MIKFSMVLQDIVKQSILKVGIILRTISLIFTMDIVIISMDSSIKTMDESYTFLVFTMDTSKITMDFLIKTMDEA